MTEDTIFAIASMTKPITCVAVMTLVEQGKLGLDDPVAKYLPELKDLRVLGDAKDDTGTEVATVPAKRPVTMRDLLSHTSGFAYGGILSIERPPGRDLRPRRATGPRPQDDRRAGRRGSPRSRWPISPAKAGPTD